MNVGVSFGFGLAVIVFLATVPLENEKANLRRAQTRATALTVTIGVFASLFSADWRPFVTSAVGAGIMVAGTEMAALSDKVSVPNV